MAFLDSISKGTQNLSQKTKNLTNIARINGLISDEEKKASGFYCQIGKR